MPAIRPAVGGEGPRGRRPRVSVACAEVDRVGRGVVPEVREGRALGHPDADVAEAAEEDAAVLGAVHPGRDDSLRGAAPAGTPGQVLSDRPDRRTGEIAGVPYPGSGVPV